MANSKNTSSLPILDPLAEPDRAPPRLSEHELIAACCQAAAHIAAVSAAFSADSDGDSAHAAPIAEELYVAIEQALADIIATPARTAGTLQSKGRLVTPLLESETPDYIADSTQRFILGFAADVVEFLRPAVHEEWLAKDKAAA